MSRFSPEPLAFFKRKSTVGKLFRRVALLYVLILLAVIIFQRDMLFQPFAGHTTPELAGLEGFARKTFTADDGAAIPYWISTPDEEIIKNIPSPPPNTEVTKNIPSPPLGERARVRGSETTPQSPRVSTPPIILYFHGNGGGLHAFVEPLRALHAAGYTVAAMEYRGYPTAPPHPSERALISDARDFAAAMQQQFPDRKIILWGYSLGSGVAVQLATTANESAVILEAPFTAIVDRADELYRILPVRLFTRDPFLSRNYIANIGSPVLFLHGSDDLIIPPHHSKALYDLARAPKERWVFNGADHFSLPNHGAYTRAFDFIKEYM